MNKPYCGRTNTSQFWDRNWVYKQSYVSNDAHVTPECYVSLPQITMLLHYQIVGNSSDGKLELLLFLLHQYESVYEQSKGFTSYTHTHTQNITDDVVYSDLPATIRISRYALHKITEIDMYLWLCACTVSISAQFICLVYKKQRDEFLRCTYYSRCVQFHMYWIT